MNCYARSMKSVLRILKKYLGPLLTLVALGFLIVTLVRDWPLVKGAIQNADWMWIAIGIIGYWYYFFLRGLGWRHTIGLFGHKLPTLTAITIWNHSEVARFIPGNVWSLVGRATLAEREGVPPKHTAASLVLEALFLVLGAGLLSVVGLWQFFENKALFIGMIILLAICAGAIIPWAAKKIRAKFFADVPVPKLSEVVIGFWHYPVAWAAYALASYAVALAFYPLVPFWLTLSSAITAWLLGYLSLITPMGLGVREVVFVELMKNAVTAPIANVLSITSRLVLTISEVLFLGLLWVVTAVHKKAR